MKHTFFTSLILLIFSLGLVAQSLDSGKKLYQNGDYERAIRVFKNEKNAESSLFIAKSYYALGEFSIAKKHIEESLSYKDDSFKIEALYTNALILFQLDDFSSSLEALYQINSNTTQNVFKSRSVSFYNQLLDYLSINQIKRVFKEITNPEILIDVIDGSFGRVDYSKASVLLSTFKHLFPDYSGNKLNKIETVLSNQSIYQSRYPQKKYSNAPNGMSYKIGVALPSFDVYSENYEISQHIYFGIQQAVEEFNSEISDKKAFLYYQETNSDNSSPADVLNHLTWKNDVDVVIGPLFSETAKLFSELSEAYETPIITPLANSDSLNLANNYMFQLNPTFGISGTKMAQYAVNTLRLDTVAVLADLNSLGKASALAFRHEAERLGAYVQHFFLKDLASNGYDIYEYTQYLSKSDSLAPGLKAIYAPFTGAAASTLIRNLITDLEATRSDYILLGTEDWSDIDPQNLRLPETQIFYSSGFEINNQDSKTSEFISKFRIRFETEPNLFAFVGYDVASVVLKTLDRVENPDYLKNGLRELGNYSGLSTNVIFNGEHINQFIRIKNAANN